MSAQLEWVISPVAECRPVRVAECPRSPSVAGVYRGDRSGRVLLTANPESEAKEGVAAHTVNVAGDVSVGGELDAQLSQKSLVMLADALMPIGFVYVQYPNTDEPNVLYAKFGLVWEEITPNYAGDFFRAAGGNALAFNGGGRRRGCRI